MLDFLTPYPFATKPGQPTQLSRTFFLGDLAWRLLKLLDLDRRAAIQAAGADITLLPWYWRLQKRSRASHSQPGQRQWLIGCTGPLYLKGELAPLLPYLALAEEIQLGRELTFGRGYFRLHVPGPAYFEKNLHDKKILSTLATEILAERDDVAGCGDDECFASTLQQHLARDPKLPAESLPAPLPQALLRHLHRLLAPIFNPMFDAPTPSYRKGYSLATAVERIHTAFQHGLVFVATANLPQAATMLVPERLAEALDALLPDADRAFRAWLRAGWQAAITSAEAGERADPLTRLLLNLYWQPLDTAVLATGATLVRQDDAFILLAASREQAEAAAQAARVTLAELGMDVLPDDLIVQEASTGLTFLGVAFGAQAATAEPPPVVRKPVYITQHGCFLGVSGQTLDIRCHDQEGDRLPLHRVSEIIVQGQASFSSALVRQCHAHDIPLSLELGSGQGMTTIIPNTAAAYRVAYRQAVKFERLDTMARCDLAKTLVKGKLEGYRTLFQQRYHPGTQALLQALARAMQSAEAAADVAQLRGVEGAAARRCFAELNTLIIPEALRMARRRQQNPDPGNSLLNFCYHLLYIRLNSIVRALGLNPFLGFLHAPDNRYESLVYDLMEIFRTRIDRLVLRLFNLKTVGIQDFVATDQGARLTSAARRRVLMQFERELLTPGRGGEPPLGETLYAQAVLVRDYFVADRPWQLLIWNRRD
ncbi:CRISPR-associated endonuclease Cas1 [Thiorhodovibrio frisius]|uniref:CRISPR-associated endonuclease Cas1 n=1 Tax=Thiorhodovibrio frisius TaxID=631362 RepID=UPI00167FD4A7|nr:CRISPR-associated endonuclease Cas1 [Thiorhodovibrio frisius]